MITQLVGSDDQDANEKFENYLLYPVGLELTLPGKSTSRLRYVTLLSY